VTPEQQAWLAKEVRRNRRWSTAYSVWATLVGLVASAGWLAFLAYREWRIWR
jgi:hypothetical protein